MNNKMWYVQLITIANASLSFQILILVAVSALFLAVYALLFLTLEK